MKKIITKVLMFMALLVSVLSLVGCEIPSIVISPTEKEEYTITIDCDNGEAVGTVTVKNGEKLAEPNTPNKEKFTFVGWYKNGVQYDFNSEVKTDFTLLAKWAEKTYKITYVLRNGETVIKDYEAEKSVTKYEPVEEGYEFKGWFEEVDGVVSETEFSFVNFKITKDIKLVSSWDINKYTVSFNTGDAPKIKSQTVEYNGLITKPEDPVLEGSTFQGWYYLYNDDQIDINFETYKVTKDITIYARMAVELIDINHFESKMNSYLTDINYDDFTLPTTLYGYKSISWSCNYAYLLNDNKFTRPYKETTVTLTANVTFNDDSTSSATFEVTLPGYKLEKATNVASTYIYRNYGKMTNDLFETMDIIYCAFGSFNADGTFNDNKTLENINNLIIPEAHKNGVYVVLSLDPSSPWTTVMNPSNDLTDTLVSNIVSIVNKYGLDGIDIDWETPKSGQETWFTSFASKLNTAIKNLDNSKLVTAAITGGQWQINHYDTTNSAQYLDYVNMMTYGMERENKHYQNALYASTNTLTSCSIDESITIFNNKGITSNKILVGLAFYGIKQTKVDGVWGNAVSILYNSLKEKYINDTTNYEVKYDTTAGVPYIISKDGNTFISYDNETSILEKCNYIKTKGIAGVMAWEAGCDTSMDLIKAIKQGLNK